MLLLPCTSAGWAEVGQAVEHQGWKRMGWMRRQEGGQGWVNGGHLSSGISSNMSWDQAALRAAAWLICALTEGKSFTDDRRHHARTQGAISFL